MPAETNLEALLPDGKYISKWKKYVDESFISFYLKIYLPNSIWKYDKAINLQELLYKYKLSIDIIKKGFWNSIMYYGDCQDENLIYTLIAREPFSTANGQVIVLKGSKNSEGLGKIVSLMNVIKEYISFLEKEKQEEEKE